MLCIGIIKDSVAVRIVSRKRTDRLPNQRNQTHIATPHFLEISYHKKENMQRSQGDLVGLM